MEPKQLAREISNECLDQDGFLVQLHSYSKFDDKRYRILIEDVSAYADFLADNDRIDRLVAGCLFELMTALATALDSFAVLGHPDLQKVRDAHAELDELLHNRVFPIPPRSENSTP